MAENAPPAAAANGASDAARVGVPYYERLKRDLRESLQKKRQIDNNLVCKFCICHSNNALT
jgi:chromatin modification-related protein EAF6